VVRPGDVVAERGRPRADEHAPGAAHARRERLGLGAHELQVLGRERLGGAKPSSMSRTATAR
jgi:hypothetical protein